MEENLVGYLLNALDPETQRQVEAYLQTHPQAHQRLELLRGALEPLAEGAEDAPPPDLSVRTLAFIARHDCRPGNRRGLPLGSLPPAPRPLASQVASGRSWWRRTDVLVAAALLIAVVGLLLPWLPHLAREQSIYACQNNLRLFHEALVAYSDHHDGNFPKVEAEPPRNVAGIFVPLLEDSGTLASGASVTCPASGHRPLPNVSVRQLEEMQRQHPEEFRAVVHDLAGCYAYSLGYGTPDDHFGLRRDDDGRLPILADRPNFRDGTLAEGNSLNHGGRGQNVLYIDGHVRFCTVRNVGVGMDDIYVNQEGEVAAGCNRQDSVLGCSWVTPYPSRK